MRADVDLASDPVSWRPARDFSGVFRLQDLRESGAENLEASEHNTMHERYIVIVAKL